MIAIRTAGVVVAAGLLVGCQQKREPVRGVAPQPQPMLAAESLKQSLVQSNPGARVGIVAATYGRLAAATDLQAENIGEGSAVQILDANGEVLGYGTVLAIKNGSVHVEYAGDTRRGPEVGDLVMPATDAGVPMAEEMPAGAPMQPAEATEPSLLPPRRAVAPADEPAPADALAPADAPADAQPAVTEPVAPAAALVVTEEATPEFQPAPGADKPVLPPVDEGAAEPAPEAAQPAPDAVEPTPDAVQPAPDAAAAEPSPGDTNDSAGGDAKAPESPAPQGAADEPQPDQGKAPEAETPGLNK